MYAYNATFLDRRGFLITAADRVLLAPIDGAAPTSVYRTDGVALSTAVSAGGSTLVVAASAATHRSPSTWSTRSRSYGFGRSMSARDRACRG